VLSTKSAIGVAAEFREKHFVLNIPASGSVSQEAIDLALLDPQVDVSMGIDNAPNHR
jgi:hypothetical protein